MLNDCCPWTEGLPTSVTLIRIVVLLGAGGTLTLYRSCCVEFGVPTAMVEGDCSVAVQAALLKVAGDIVYETPGPPSGSVAKTITTTDEVPDGNEMVLPSGLKVPVPTE